jgi:hypothetical protein
MGFLALLGVRLGLGLISWGLGSAGTGDAPTTHRRPCVHWGSPTRVVTSSWGEPTRTITSTWGAPARAITTSITVEEC